MSPRDLIHSQNPNQSIDLIIIGAGPAGISTALHLIRLDPGWASRMIILEKAQHPRHKLCGGGLTYFGLRVLKQLGIQNPLPVPQISVNNLHFRYHNQEFHAHGSPLIVVYHRSKLDDYLVSLARKNGVKIYENQQVQSVQSDDNGVRVETDQQIYQAKVVVCADGSKGIGRRLVQNNESASRTARAIETFFELEKWNDSREPLEVVFDFTPVDQALQGYFWQIPMQMDGKPFENRGVYDSRIFSNKKRAVLPDILDASFKALGDELDQNSIEGHPIHLFTPRSKFSSNRILLVGDAAGVDPLLGEGIGPALGYGWVAAREIQQAVEQNEFSFRHYRFRLCFSPVGRTLLIRYTIAKLLYRFSHHKWFTRSFWWAASILDRIVLNIK